MYLLKKSLYGLKQSLRQWYRGFDNYVTKIGFKRSEYDSRLYFKDPRTERQVYLLLYVDDMLITSSDPDKVREVKRMLGSEFDMKDLREAKRILGIYIKRNRKQK